MTVTAVLRLEIRSGNESEAREVLRRVVAETRAFDGCLGVDAYADSSTENNWVLVERWASADHDWAYRQFRAGPGVVTDLGAHLAGKPRLELLTTSLDI